MENWADKVRSAPKMAQHPPSPQNITLLFPDSHNSIICRLKSSYGTMVFPSLLIVLKYCERQPWDFVVAAID